MQGLNLTRKEFAERIQLLVLQHEHSQSAGYHWSLVTGIPILTDTSGLHQANGCEMKRLPVPPAGRKVLLEGSISMAISPPSDTSSIEAAWCPSRLAPSSSKTCTISVIIKSNGPTTLEHLTQSTHVSCNSAAQPHFVCNTKPAESHTKSTQTVQSMLKEKHHIIMIMG